MVFTPYKWQLRDVETLRAANFTGLVAVETGGGKTALASLVIYESGAGVVLIVAPKQTHKSAWKVTVESVAGRPVKVIGNGSKVEREALDDFLLGFEGVYVCTPEFVTRSDISRWYGDLLIVDEVHQLSKPGSKGQRKLSGFTKSDGIPLSGRFRMRIAMSGTPLRNSFERAWSITRFLWPELNNADQIASANHWMWLHKRMTSVSIPVGGGRRATKWMREREPGKLFSEMPTLVQHFRRRYCCDAHPNGFLKVGEPQVIRKTVALSKEQARMISELEKNYLTWLEDRPLVTDLTITQQQRIRQVCLGVPTFDDEGNVSFAEDCMSPFYDTLVEIVDSLEEGEPVVVFVESQRFAKVVTARLNGDGITAFEYSGKTKGTRDDAIEKFGSEFQVAVVVISAGGTGLDGLQRVAQTEVWLERSVDATLNIQAEARTDRIGSRGQVQRYMLSDDHGYADGRFSQQLTKMLELRRSTG